MADDSGAGAAPHHEEPLDQILIPVALVSTGVALDAGYIAGADAVCAGTVFGCAVVVYHAPVVLGGGAALVGTGVSYFVNQTVPYFFGNHP